MVAPLSQVEGRKLIEAELRPGEEPLWIGTPAPWSFPPVALVLCILFGAIISLSALFLAGAALSLPNWLDAAWSPLLLVLALPLLAAGLACLYWPVSEHRQAARRAHAITNIRLLTVTSLDAPRVVSRDIGSVVRMTSQHGLDGRGTLHIDMCGKSSDGEGGYSNEIETWRSIPDVRRAEAAVHEARQRDRGEPDKGAYRDGPGSELATLFSSTLEAAETLRWAAFRTRPRPARTASGVAWRAFIAALVLAIGYGLSAATRPIQMPIAVAAVVFGSLLTLGVALVIRHHRRQLLADTAHAVTDRRLIKITRGLPLQVSSIRLEQIRGVRRFDGASQQATLAIEYASGVHEGRWIKETEIWYGLADARGVESAILDHWLTR